jgi:thiol-disulfide isomerase/thioredoxin
MKAFWTNHKLKIFSEMNKMIITVLMFSSIAVSIFLPFEKTEQKIEAQNETYIPAITLQSTDNQSIILNEKSGKFSYLIFFDSFCDHCQTEAALLQKHIKDFQKARIVFISNQKMRNIKIFASEYKLDKIPNIKFCQIELDVSTQYFGNLGYPSIFIYNTKNQLVKKYSGNTKIEELTKYLR